MATLRIALAQMNALVGAVSHNASTIADLRERAAARHCDLVVTPELALTGYPPEDLLLKDGFINKVALALEALVGTASPTALAVGSPVAGLALDRHADSRGDHGRLANALVLAASGTRMAVATKRHLPNYDVFDEQRYFAAGVGPLTLHQLRGVAVGFLICEDLWLSDGPAAQLAREGARVLIVANASPYAQGRQLEREAMLAQRARETNCVIVYVNLVGGQDELVFDGQSVVVNARGEVVARAVAFAEELLIVDIDTETLDVASGEVAELLDPVAEVYGALVLGTRDYITKNGFRRAILGLSGGVDSALVATIAADAIGADKVAVFALPSRYSSDHSLSDAAHLATNVGLSMETLPIEAAHRALTETLGTSLGGELKGLTDENLQSRIRGLVLMAISNDTGAIVLTTGNKSEMATGYSTLYGDSAGGFAVIKDVPKTLVYAACRWRNDHARARGETPPIPDNILTKAPSAELRPDQRDDQSLPPYDLLDPLLAAYVEGDATVDELVAQGYDRSLVERIVRLVDRSEYKRRQTPPGVRITPKAFGKDRRLPITNGFTSEDA